MEGERCPIQTFIASSQFFQSRARKATPNRVAGASIKKEVPWTMVVNGKDLFEVKRQ